MEEKKTKRNETKEINKSGRIERVCVCTGQYKRTKMVLKNIYQRFIVCRLSLVDCRIFTNQYHCE